MLYHFDAELALDHGRSTSRFYQLVIVKCIVNFFVKSSQTETYFDLKRSCWYRKDRDDQGSWQVECNHLQQLDINIKINITNIININITNIIININMLRYLSPGPLGSWSTCSTAVSRWTTSPAGTSSRHSYLYIFAYSYICVFLFVYLYNFAFVFVFIYLYLYLYFISV